MKGSIKRTLKSRQIGLVQTYHLISGAAATPADSGLDKFYVQSVVDNGVGDYTINFIEPARMDVVVAGLISLTANAILSIQAVSSSSVSVLSKNAAGAALDANFALVCVHSKLVDAIY